MYRNELLFKEKKKNTKASHSLTPSSSLGDRFPSGETGWETGTRNRIQICLEVGWHGALAGTVLGWGPRGGVHTSPRFPPGPHPRTDTAGLRFWPGGAETPTAAAGPHGRT